MGTPNLWMIGTVVLLLTVVLVTAEETVRRRGACVSFQRELRRGVYPSVRIAEPSRHLHIVEALRKAA